MAENDGAKETPNGKTDETSDPDKLQDVFLDFGDFVRAKREPDRRAVIYCQPEELGVHPDDLGLKKTQRVGVLYRALKPGENSEVLEAVRPFEGDALEDEYNIEILFRCLEKPTIPHNAQGRKVLLRWLPGTRATVASAVRNLSGMGIHQVGKAADELGKLAALTPST